LQVSYFIYCTVFVDFADSGPGKSWMKPRLQQNKKIRDFIFVSLVFPVTIVSITYFTNQLKSSTEFTERSLFTKNIYLCV